MKNVKGFSLPEILLVVFLLAILGTIAISSYLNSSGTFNYLGQYKNTVSAIRTARNFAITNKTTDDQSPKYYGVYIEEKKVTAFADLGTTILKYDASDVALFEKEFDFTDQDFTLRALDMQANPVNMPIALFYESGSGNLEIRRNAATSNDIMPKTDKCVSLEATGNDNRVKKYIVIFQVSGLAEEYDDLVVCDTSV